MSSPRRGSRGVSVTSYAPSHREKRHRRRIFDFQWLFGPLLIICGEVRRHDVNDESGRSRFTYWHAADEDDFAGLPFGVLLPARITKQA